MKKNRMKHESSYKWGVMNGMIRLPSFVKVLINIDYDSGYGMENNDFLTAKLTLSIFMMRIQLCALHIISTLIELDKIRRSIHSHHV